MPLPCFLRILVGCLFMATLAGCTAPARSSFAPSPTHAATNAQPAQSSILVISAVYGSGDRFADVTYQVNGLLKNAEATFWAKPRWLGADPTPGWNKALVIVFEQEGRRRLFSTGEGGEVSVRRLLAEAATQPKAKPTKAKNKRKPSGRKSQTDQPVESGAAPVN